MNDSDTRLMKNFHSARHNCLIEGFLGGSLTAVSEVAGATNPRDQRADILPKRKCIRWRNGHRQKKLSLPATKDSYC